MRLRAMVILAWGSLAACGAGGGLVSAPSSAISLTDGGTGGDEDKPRGGGETVAVRAAETNVAIDSALRPAGSVTSDGGTGAAARGATAVAVAAKGGVMPLSRGDGTPLDAQLREGDEAYERDEFPAAQRHFEQAQKLAPRDPAPIVGLARVAIALSRVPTDFNSAPKNPAIEKAAAQLKHALALSPKYPPAQLELGRAWLILGRGPDALSELVKAAELSPKNAEAQSALGVAYLANGKGELALSALAKAAMMDPTNPDRQMNLGTAFLMRGRVREAIATYELAVELAPDDGKIVGDFGAALLADNQLPRAVATLRRAVGLEPGRATLRSNLGYALQQTRAYSKAIIEYREAIRLDPQLSSAWINLATALAQTGELVKAREALELARRLDPSDPRVKANMAELKDLEKRGNPR